MDTGLLIPSSGVNSGYTSTVTSLGHNMSQWPAVSHSNGHPTCAKLHVNSNRWKGFPLFSHVVPWVGSMLMNQPFLKLGLDAEQIDLIARPESRKCLTKSISSGCSDSRADGAWRCLWRHGLWMFPIVYPSKPSVNHHFPLPQISWCFNIDIWYPVIFVDALLILIGWYHCFVIPHDTRCHTRRRCSDSPRAGGQMDCSPGLLRLGAARFVRHWGSCHTLGAVCTRFCCWVWTQCRKMKKNFGSYLGCAHLILTVSSYIYIYIYAHYIYIYVYIYIYIYQTNFGGPMLAESSQESLDSRFSWVSSLFFVCVCVASTSQRPTTMVVSEAFITSLF